MVFPGGSVVKICLQCRRCRQEIQVSFLSQEDPLEEEMAIHSSILAWKIPPYGVAKESDMTGRLNNKQQELSYHLLPGEHFRAIAHSFISCSAFTHAAKDRIWKNICDYDVKRVREYKRKESMKKAKGGEMCDRNPPSQRAQCTTEWATKEVRCQAVFQFPPLFTTIESVTYLESHWQIFYMTSEAQSQVSQPLGKYPVLSSGLGGGIV